MTLFLLLYEHPQAGRVYIHVGDHSAYMMGLLGEVTYNNNYFNYNILPQLILLLPSLRALCEKVEI